MIVMMMMIKIATSAPVLFSEMQKKKEELRTLARKFSNIDFFSENFAIER